MSYIVSEVYEALREAGATEEKAKAAAGAIPVGQYLASKQDIAEVKAKIADLKVSFYRQLWIMGAGIVTVNAGMLTAIVALGKLFPK